MRLSVCDEDVALALALLSSLDDEQALSNKANALEITHTDDCGFEINEWEYLAKNMVQSINPSTKDV